MSVQKKRKLLRELLRQYKEATGFVAPEQPKKPRQPAVRKPVQPKVLAIGDLKHKKRPNCSHPQTYEQKKNSQSRETERRFNMYNLPRWMREDETKEWYPFNNRAVQSIDGEGVTLEDGSHIYTLLAAHHEATNVCTSVEPHPNSKHGLTTVQCFEFLLSLDPETVKVGFAVTYDVNMMLKDIPKTYLKELVEQGETRWDSYLITWVPGKFFRLKEFSSFLEEDSKRAIHLWDIFPFFQKSFVRTLTEWQLTDPQVIESISAMKDKRSSFQTEDPEDVKRYCYQEVELCSKLTRKLLDQTKRTDIRIKRLDGAGAVASAIMEKYEVKSFLEPVVNGRKQLPFEVYQVALKAYYGGRFDIARVGHFPGKTYEYDIRSAYPEQMVSLPCLNCGEWKPTKRYDPANSVALYRVTWNLGLGQDKDGHICSTTKQSLAWPPFPFRSKNGGIFYPADGMGWYYTTEIESARRLYPTARIEVHEGFEFIRPRECEASHRPFSFVPILYAERARLKAAGDFGQMILKLGLNALYGKTAQSIGWGEKSPPNQSFIWAGMITAGTRAKIADAIRQDPEAVISVATDAVISTHPLDLDIGTSLGQWEAFEIQDLMLIQSGFMTYVRDDERKWKNRGFSTKAVDVDLVEDAWNKNGVLSLVDTRFIGLQTALLRKDWTVWRRWMEVPKVIDMFQGNGRIFYPPDSEFIEVDRSNKNYTLFPWIMEILLQLKMIDTPESVAYQPKSKWSDAYTLHMMDEIIGMREQP